MLRFFCPHCEKRLKAPSATAGETATCSRCLKRVIIPVRSPDDDFASQTACGPDDRPYEQVEAPVRVLRETAVLLSLILCSLAVPFFTFVAVWNGTFTPILISAGCSLPLLAWFLIAYPDEAGRLGLFSLNTAEKGTRVADNTWREHVRPGLGSFWNFCIDYVWPVLYWILYVAVIVTIAVVGLMFVLLIAVLTKGKTTLRPLNVCLRCGHTWYPRGSNYSAQCPHCGVAR